MMNYMMDFFVPVIKNIDEPCIKMSYYVIFTILYLLFKNVHINCFKIKISEENMSSNKIQPMLRRLNMIIKICLLSDKYISSLQLGLQN